MGVVYRATDSKLKREVAIKVLPEEFAADAERLARFEREAQLLAQLQHPNIASIYGLEESGGVRALVMELVEGEDLSERLKRGPLPVDEALAVARQIAEALEAAHEKGIVHRDLKPANVKLTSEGKVKVLDFGLAKAMAPESAASGSPSTSPTLMNSPTLTAAHGTQLGVILGTAAYMAPEQARGSAVDKRADVWAFGVVFYEMLAGRRLFEGETVSDTLAAVLRQEVDFSALPPATPPSVRRLLARCLERDPRRRQRGIGDARLDLDEKAGPPPVAPSTGAVASRRSVLPWTVAALAVGLAGFLGWQLLGRSPSSPAPTVAIHARLGLEPAEALLGSDPSEIRVGSRRPSRTAIALSPDGRWLAFTGEQNGTQQLFLRDLRRAAAAAVAGTTGADNPFFSPDGRWIGFWSDGALRKVPVDGGPAIEICRTERLRGADWAADGRIAFGAVGTAGALRSIQWVSSDGGKPAAAHDDRPGDARDRPCPAAMAAGRPHSLHRGHPERSFGPATGPPGRGRQRPAGARGERHRRPAGGRRAHPRLHARLDADGGEVRRRSRGDRRRRRRRDRRRPRLAQRAQCRHRRRRRPVRRERRRHAGLPRRRHARRRARRAHVDGSAGSTAADRDGRGLLPGRSLLAGRSPGPGLYERHQASDLGLRPGPAHLHEAAVRRRGGLADLDAGRQGDRLLREDDDCGRLALPDVRGRHRPGRARSPVSAERAFRATGRTTATSWSTWTPRRLLETSPRSRCPERPPACSFEVGKGSAGYAAVSPDGRWLAYSTNESGRGEVFVQPWAGGTRTPVSTSRGHSPRWARDGRELVYLQPLDGGRAAYWSVPVAAGPTLTLGTPRRIGEAAQGEFGTTVPMSNYDVAPDGRLLGPYEITAPRRGRHGRRLPRDRLEAEARGRDQGPPRGVRRATRTASPASSARRRSSPSSSTRTSPRSTASRSRAASAPSSWSSCRARTSPSG